MPLSAPLRAAIETADLSHLQSTVLELCSKHSKVNCLFSKALLPNGPTDVSINHGDVESSPSTIKQEQGASPVPSMRAEAASSIATTQEVAASDMPVKQDAAATNTHTKQESVNPIPATQATAAPSSVLIKQEPAGDKPHKRKAAAATPRLAMCTRQNCTAAFDLDDNPMTGCFYHTGLSIQKKNPIPPHPLINKYH